MDNELVIEIADAVNAAMVPWLPPIPETRERVVREVEEAIRQALASQPQERGEAVAYGCHCDLEPHMEPDGCVIDEGRRQDCMYACSTVNQIGSKEECEYARVADLERECQKWVIRFNGADAERRLYADRIAALEAQLAELTADRDMWMRRTEDTEQEALAARAQLSASREREGVVLVPAERYEQLLACEDAMVSLVKTGCIPAEIAGRTMLAAAPVQVPDVDWQSRNDALFMALELCSAELFAQCADQKRAMNYVERARKALAQEQCFRASIGLAAPSAPAAPAVDAEKVMALVEEYGRAMGLCGLGHANAVKVADDTLAQIRALLTPANQEAQDGR